MIELEPSNVKRRRCCSLPFSPRWGSISKIQRSCISPSRSGSFTPKRQWRALLMSMVGPWVKSTAGSDSHLRKGLRPHCAYTGRHVGGSGSGDGQGPC